MKRILSLTLALVMILGTFTGVFAAEETAEEAAAKFLAKEEILLGDDNGDLMLKDNLERRDAVILLSRLLGVEEVAKGFDTSEETPSWKDARTDVYYIPFFAWAEANGYFEGDDEGNFNPRGAITAEEFALVLLRALGYDAKGYESWKAALNSAKAIGLLEGVEVEFGDKVVRGQMAVMIYNALETEMNEPAGVTLAEHLGIEMPAPEVLEVKVKADNLKEIKIELNNAKLVDEDQVEDARNYRTDAGNVVDAKLEGDTIVLTLDRAMTQNGRYELTTRYIKGLELDKEVFTAYDNQAPAVEKVTVLGTKGIRVRMTEPVEGAKEKDFLLNGRNFVMRVKHYGRDILLLPYREDGTFEEGTHELTVGSLEDYAGFKSRSEVHEIEIVEDATKPEVAKVIARNTSVIVEFVNEVHPDSVSKKNVSWTEVRGRKAVEADDFEILAGNKIEYKFNANKELPKPAATITVSGLENYSGYAMDKYEAIHDIEVDFSRPEIVNFKLISKTEMEIEFNKTLDERTAEDVDNYVLSEYKLADKEYKVSKYAIEKAELSGKVVKVTFIDGSLTEGNKYKLAVEGVRDNTTLRNTMIADELEFTYGIGQNLEVVAVRERTNEKIVLEFNKDLVRREAEDLRNYEFILVDEAGKFFRASDLSKNPSVYLYGNGRTVEINLPGNARTIVEIELGSGLTALDGNRVHPDARRIDMNTNYLKATKATLNAKGDTLTVEFNQKLVNQNINLAGITVTTATVTAAKVNASGNLVLTLDPAVNNVTGINITAAANVQGQYDTAPVATSVAAANITNNRDVVATITSVDVDLNDATIVVTLNKKVSTDVQKATDLLIDGSRYASLSDANNIAGGTVYTFNITNATVLAKLQTVGTVVRVVNASEGINGRYDIKLADLDSAVADQQAATSFKTAHATILAKTAADVTLADLADVKVARNAYNALGGSVQALLVTEDGVLTALEAELLTQAQGKLTDTKSRVAFTFTTEGTAADGDTVTVDTVGYDVKTAPVAGQVSVAVAQALYNAHNSADDAGTNIDIVISQNNLLISNINLFLESVVK